MRLCRGLAPGLILLAPFLAAQEPKPDWVSGDSAKYPRGTYVTGVGQGPTQEKAADKARAELAKSLSMDISATSNSSIEETDNGAASSSSQSASNEVRTSTSKILDGVEIAGYWDDGQGNIYALAVLDRARSLKTLKDKLEETDKSLASLHERLDKSDGKFAKLKLALKMVRLANLRRHYNADYRSLNPDGTGLPAPEDASNAVGHARKAIAAITVQVDAGDEKVTSRLIDALSAYGLRAVEKSDNKSADVVVEAKASAEELPSDNLTWYWARGSMLVKMSYGSSGEVFNRFEEDGKEAANDPSSSVDVTMAMLSAKTADHVFKVLTSNDVLDD